MTQVADQAQTTQAQTTTPDLKPGVDPRGLWTKDDFAPAVKFIEQHFRESPRLAEVAASVKVSPFHFHRLFRKVMGTTAKAMVTELQVEEAKRLLRDTSMPLAEIAERCGFAHQSHFTARFRQLNGMMTPFRYRRLARTPGAPPS